jgi:hypothetical protein
VLNAKKWERFFWAKLKWQISQLQYGKEISIYLFNNPSRKNALPKISKITLGSLLFSFGGSNKKTFMLPATRKWASLKTTVYLGLLNFEWLLLN